MLLALVEADGLVDESELLELVEPEVPDAPIELVLPGVVLPPIALELLPGVPLLPGVDELLELVVSEEGAGIVVDDELVEVDGAPGVSVRFVQAPSETAATSARAAHEVSDAFIGRTP